MRRFYFVPIIAAVCLFSCSGDDNPLVADGPLFSITVLRADGSPDGPLRVGSINHPIGAKSSPGSINKPCPTLPITFSVPEPVDYELTIYNYNGLLVRTYAGHADAGVHVVEWDGLDSDSVPVPSGFYRYHLIADGFTAGKWAVLESGPDPHQTIIGGLDRSGNYTTDDTALFPGLIREQPIEYYTDTVTIHLSHPDFPDDFFMFTVRLKPGGNSFSLQLDTLGLPSSLR